MTDIIIAEPICDIQTQFRNINNKISELQKENEILKKQVSELINHNNKLKENELNQLKWLNKVATKGIPPDWSDVYARTELSNLELLITYAEYDIKYFMIHWLKNYYTEYLSI